MAVQVQTCTEFYQHYGEQRVRDFLVEKLEDEGYAELLMNNCVPSKPNALEIDLTLINAQGVFVIEVKDLFGTIDADDRTWHRSHGFDIPNPVRGIEHKARVTHSFLTKRDPVWKDVNVTGLVVLAKHEKQLTGYDYKTYHMDDDLIKALTGMRHVRSGTIDLDRDLIREVCLTLFRARPVGQVRTVAGYPVSGMTPRGHYAELEAHDIEFKDLRVRIKQYEIPEITSQEQLDRARGMFKRDMAALLRAGPHPHLVIPHRFHRDPGSDHRYYLVFEWINGVTLEERIAAGEMPPVQQLRIVRAVADALAHCHDHRVIHRNLTPEAIYLTTDDQIKVGDFDFAKMPSVTRTFSSTGMLKIDTLYAAPEVARNAHMVDERADIYSLGAVWYDMAVGVDPPGPIRSARVEETALPDAAKRLLRAMLRGNRDARPLSMTEVRDRVENILSQPPFTNRMGER